MKIAFYITESGRSPVEDFIKSLPKNDVARFLEVYEGIRRDGLQYPRAQFRQLSGKLWEIKFTAPGGGFRIAYVVVQRDTMIWLHAFRKTSQKTPRTELRMAEKRMGEVI
jgi:phage-related protein